MKKEFFMNYAEGQGAPTVKHDNETKATKEAERLAEKLGVQVTTLKAVVQTKPKDITKRVTSYEAACAVLGIEPVVDEVLQKLGFKTEEIALRKLTTIAEALNEGWRPDWTNSNEYKYWPWFVFDKDTAYYGSSAGLSFAGTIHSASFTHTRLGSRLCYKTRELAAFAGKTFEGLYNDFFLIK